jgi:hypothetical protein
MDMRVALLCFALCGVCALRLFGQDAGDMDALLETPAVSASQAARFVLGAAGLLPPGLSGAAAEQAAWDAAREQGWLTGEPGRPLRLREAAFLVTGAFGFKGGLMYTLFPGPRYAYRELLHLKIIQGRADGSSAVPGERLLQIIGRALRHSGEDARLDAALAAAGEAPAETPAPEERLEVPAGEGLSSGPEGLLPYREDFEIE